MSFIPAFELGLWNAWILAIPMLFIFFSAVKVAAAREAGYSKADDFQLTKKEKRLANAPSLIMFIAFFYTVFLPLQLNTLWLYGGLIIYLFGIVFTIVAVQNFATSPKGMVITKGLYRFSRNPMFIGMLLMEIGLGIVCFSWVYLLLAAMLIISLNAAVLPAEERYLLHRYGDDYRKYMNRTPRWIGISKLQETE
jgi:protein-S-isoprenylcysteine O-methyltransferase Ste14